MRPTPSIAPSPRRAPLVGAAAPLALALTACVVPEVLGNNSETQGSTADSDVDTEPGTTGGTDTTGGSGDTGTGTTGTGTTEGTSTTEASSTGPETDTSTGTDTDAAPACGEAPTGAPAIPLWSVFDAGFPDGYTRTITLATNIHDQLALAGTQLVSDADQDARVERRDPALGEALWSKTYAGEHGLADLALDVLLADDGTVDVLVRETVVDVPSMAPDWAPETVDARLVVLRYQADGALLWRWEQTHPAVAEHEKYEPAGVIHRDGDGVRVLHWALGEATQVFAVDGDGVLASTTPLATPPGIFLDAGELAESGDAYLVGHSKLPEKYLWVGRFDVGGALLWDDQPSDPNQIPIPHAVVPMPGGDVAIAYALDNKSRIRRYDPSGAEVWTVLADEAGQVGVLGGAVRCDGALVMTGDWVPTSPGVEPYLGWIGVFAAEDGAKAWSTDQDYAQSASFGWGSAIVGLRAGLDVIALGSRLDVALDRPWLGRMSGL
ncbi:MAG: hypothetical protein R3B09_06360 [Nannocystaceae bacterium]